MIELRLRHRFGRQIVCALILLSVSIPGAAEEAKTTRDAWTALTKGGHVALIRHGNAPPGYGDPPGFRIDDCKTQRNLDSVGRQQAKSLGEMFRRHGVKTDRIQSSPICRCMETARLMDLGHVESAMALTPDRNLKEPMWMPELKERISLWRGPGTLVLVTHAETIMNMLGTGIGQGETLVVKPAPGSGLGMHIVGTIPAPR